MTYISDVYFIFLKVVTKLLPRTHLLWNSTLRRPLNTSANGNVTWCKLSRMMTLGTSAPPWLQRSATFDRYLRNSRPDWLSTLNVTIVLEFGVLPHLNAHVKPYAEPSWNATSMFERLKFTNANQRYEKSTELNVQNHQRDNCIPNDDVFCQFTSQICLAGTAGTAKNNSTVFQ